MELSHEELVLVILANIQASTFIEISGEKQKWSPRCSFTFQGRTICKEMFLILYGISYSYSTAGEQDAITALQDCISDIRRWMIADSLKLNDDKTEFTIIGTRAQLDKDNVSEIVVGQAKVPAVTIVRNLGTWLDTNLTMSAHK